MGYHGRFAREMSELVAKYTQCRFGVRDDSRAMVDEAETGLSLKVPVQGVMRVHVVCSPDYPKSTLARNLKSPQPGIQAVCGSRSVVVRVGIRRPMNVQDTASRTRVAPQPFLGERLWNWLGADAVIEKRTHEQTDINVVLMHGHEHPITRDGCGACHLLRWAIDEHRRHTGLW
jgi:hypothetical protein